MWRDGVRNWTQGADASDSVIQRNEAAWAALKWIRDQAVRAFKEFPAEFISPWQFDLAFVLELLGLAIYDSVPMPKRVLCVLAADDLLSKLERDIPWVPL